MASATGPTRTVDRALELLAEVCTEESLTLSEAARRVGLPVSTALRLLRTLESSGFVSRNNTGEFAAGPRLIQLGAYSLGRHSLLRLAQPAMRRIGERTGESVYLAIEAPGNSAIYIGMVEGTHVVRHVSWIGRTVPLEGLAIGRALTGDVERDGYVAERDHLDPDLTAIAAPIRWAGGVAGALNLLGPTYRIDEQRMHAYGRVVASEAEALGTLLVGPNQPLRLAERKAQ
jgi:IclR family transcriptional regulator, acetate operon repressor